VGVYLSRFSGRATGPRTSPTCALRFTASWALGTTWPAPLDTGIVRTVWLTPDECACRERHRSPLVLRCMEDHLAGRRYPLDLIHTDPSVLALR
jgi:hypothetical protein